MSSSARNVSYDGYPLPLDPARPGSPGEPLPIDDFVSFPTLPDPEVVANRSLSTIISKTLRKVTNNASNLVHNYTVPTAGAAPRDHDILDSSSMYSHVDPEGDSLAPGLAASSLSNDKDNSSTHTNAPQGHSRAPSRGSRRDFLRSRPSAPSPPVKQAPTVTVPLVATAFSSEKDSKRQIPASDASPISADPSGSVDTLPRVTSDNLFLKVSSSHASKVPVASLSTSDVLAEANTNTESYHSAQNLAHSSSRLSQTDQVQQPLPKVRTEAAFKPSTVRTLQNRISSIFNNLPNDIELSDDESGSDQDTVEHDTSKATIPRAEEASTLSAGAVGFQNQPISNRKVGESSAPPREDQLRRERSVSRKASGHFPSAILDGAKSIIQANLVGTNSPNSSEGVAARNQPRKRKKQRPHRLSNNPLKNGGIPKKYWMNDSFVSDCINCFKQFTAFRRKHHCRFCGQIFCADCTIFISYSQYKQQRNGKGKSKTTNSFKDKLRVCKPCYTDVVVYLSDDSSGSEEDPIEIPPKTPSSSLKVDNCKTPTTSDNTYIKQRSYSSSSIKSNVLPSSPASKSRRTPLIHSAENSSLKIGSSPFSGATQRSPEGLTHRHPPKMAIPTRRTGEAVEIAMPSSSYTQSSSLNAYQTLRSSGHGIQSLNLIGGELPDVKGWYKQPPRRSASVSSGIGNTKGTANLGSFYKSVVNGNYNRVLAKPNLDFSRHDPDLFNQSHANGTDQEEDAESENEDEKAMSLYTSLNHLAPTSSMSTRPSNHLATSMPGVPTLLEFPGIEGKYGPANLRQSDAMTRFEFKPIDTFAGASMMESKQRSNYRSNERAKASLRRMKDRRNQRSIKRAYNGLSVTSPNDAKISGELGGSPNPFKSPMTYASNNGIIYSEDSPIKAAPSSSSSFSKDFDSNTSNFFSNIEDNLTDNAGELDDASLKTALIKSSNFHSTDSVEDSVTCSLGASFDQQLQLMIKQCLEDCEIKSSVDQTRWTAILSKLFASIHKIKISDTLDVKQYIKIKKILGGKPDDTAIMNGLFITKNIDSNRMQAKIENPRIALLVFPLEYLKQKEQFISLRVVNSQQSVYISNLVSRLVSLEPDIVIVGDTVCGLAEKLLEEANVTVISNVKAQVIERISRYTKADIFQSVNDLFFKKGSLGKCSQFEIKKFVFGDYVKTYAFFVGTSIESGFTICLRGGDEEYLSSVKYAAESLIPGAFNSRFEKSFFSDFSLVTKPPSDDPDLQLKALEALMQLGSEDVSDIKTVCVKSMEEHGVLSYVRLFNDRTLSFSPSVSYSLPQTLNNVIKSFTKFSHFYTLDKVISGLREEDKIEPEWLDMLQFDLSLERFNGRKDFLTYLQFVSKEWLHFCQRQFNFRMRTWSNSMKYSIYQLYPIFHRSIHFLHSRVSIRHATPCYGPVVVVVDFYSDNDKCLGVFLDQTLQEIEKSCDECGDLLLNHYKTYVHGEFKIDLIVDKIDDPQLMEQLKDKGKRVMWSYCPECHVSSPISVMNDETYFLSLGKFFELNFCSRSTWNEKHCEHDFFKSQVKYFGINGYFVRIEIARIVTYEVVVPRKRLEFLATSSLESKLDTLRSIQNSTSKFFESISNRLDRIKVDTFDKAEAGHEKIRQLKARVKEEESFVRAKSFRIYESTQPTNYMSLNVIQRDIQELGVAWDREFNEFETQFLPTENEITRITQFHLRNFLMERLDSEMKDSLSDMPESRGSQDVSETQAKNHDYPALRLEDTNEQKSASGNLFSIGSRRVPSTVIEDKIMQIRQSLEEDQNKHLSKSPTKPKAEPDIDSISTEHIGQQGPTRVQDLTNYFNQMTLEFQKQREAVLERQSSKYKAIPIVNSQPIVEIYDNIEDVVDVDRKRNAASKVSLALEKSSDSDRSRSKELTSQEVQNAKTHNDQQNSPFTSTGPTKELIEPKESQKSKIDIPQPEKNSLLKSLSNFWADRSATLWDPLSYPLDFTEHTFADSEVIVREDEPSSLVAFCLSTSDYKQKIAGMDPNEVISSEDKGSETLELNEQFKKKSDHFSKLERKFKKRADQSKSETTALEITLNKAKSNHLKYQFVDGATDMSCKIFYSEQFDALRKACGVDESYVQSLSRCIKWNSKGGKSGSNFLKTLDNRYILKELTKSELESFVSIAPFYFKYISQSTFNTLTTALAKIFGFYQVEFKNSENGKNFKMDFLIMENLFYNRKTTRIFDLKGSMRNRHVKQTGKENEVLLDENMIEYIYESPVFVKEQSKKLLRGSLFNDTSFLSAMDVMDYSLVIGIDDSTGKLYVGIIDWLRTFTWDKKVENWVKGKSLVGKKGKDPTIVTPKQYRTRFREAMDRYILEVPDIWYEGSS